MRRPDRHKESWPVWIAAFLSAMAIWLLFLVLGVSACAAEPAIAEMRRDGIAASLSVVSGQAALTWRFLKTGTPSLKSSRVTLSNQELNGTIWAFPWPGARSLVLVLLDVTDPARHLQIFSDKVAALQIMNARGPADLVSVIGYDTKSIPIESKNREALLNALKATAPQAQPSHLGKALASAIKALAGQQAERKTIMVLTDGHSDDALNLDSLEAKCRAADVSIYFLLSPTQRAVDVAKLRALVLACGGDVIESSQRIAFLKSPFALADSGGIGRFPLHLRARYFWQPQPNVRATLRYGDRSLSLTVPALAPAATVTETLRYLAASRPSFAVAMAALLMLSLAGAGAALWRNWPRRSVVMPQSTTLDMSAPDTDAKEFALAHLKSCDGGDEFPIMAPITQVGRAASNDIVLKHATVSRLHAVLSQKGDGSFQIENRSEANPVLLNGNRIDSASLNNGDVITLGALEFRFSKQQPLSNSSVEDLEAALTQVEPPAFKTD